MTLTPPPAPPASVRAAPEFLKKLQQAPYIERIVAECFQLFFGPMVRSGSFDIEGAGSYQY